MRKLTLKKQTVRKLAKAVKTGMKAGVGQMDISGEAVWNVAIC